MVRFRVAATTSLSPEEIVNGMFDKSNWTSFRGAGLVPGIEEVEIVRSGDSISGTTFKVKNSDGSHHEETIIEYDPGQKLVMKLHPFSSPLNKFALHFHEIWTFHCENNLTHFERTFELYPKHMLGSILLRAVAFFFKKGVENHTKTIVA